MKVAYTNESEGNEKVLNEILTKYKPISLNDTILNYFQKYGFEKQKIDLSKFESVKDIFQLKKHERLDLYRCLPVYRDILIFKNKNQIIGTAKICFSCDEHVISGTEIDTEYFGQSGEYKKLFKILDENLKE